MFVLYNPHVDDFLAEPPHFRLLKRRALKKYGYIIEQEIEQKGRVNILVDGTISAVVPHRIYCHLPLFVRKMISFLEIYYWKKINDLAGVVNRIDDNQDVSSDTLFCFSYKSATGDMGRRLNTFNRFKRTIFHLSHYFISTSEKSNNLKKVANCYLAGDSNLSDNIYFSSFFEWYNKEFILIPFSVADRFKQIKPFSDREKKCVATGTFHNLKNEVPTEKYSDYMAFFDLDTYHPIRKELHENRDVLDLIDVKVSPYRPDSSGIYKKIINHFFVSQKKYFSIDIVKLYNDYKYVVIGEEASGFPALGSFEAMACGTVLIADPNYYCGLGMEPGVHFFPHNGSLNSISEAIYYLNNNHDVAEKISKNSISFVNDNFRKSISFKTFNDVVEQ